MPLVCFYPDAYLYLPRFLRVLGLSFVASMAIFLCLQ